MSDINRVEDLVIRSMDKQEAFHDEVRVHIGKTIEFQDRMLDFKRNFTVAHETLRGRHDVLSKRVAWLIGIGSAIVFSISVGLSLAAML